MYRNRPKFGPEQYDPGAIIVHQGDVPDKFYILTRGEVEVVFRREDGSEEILNRLGPGDFFGEIGMLKRSRRMATVRACTEVDVMAMDGSTFSNWLNTSMLSRDEINLVMEERISNAGVLQPVGEDEVAKEATEEIEETAVEHVASYEDSSRESASGEPETGVLDFAIGETIIHQGDIADKFYMLVEGEVEVYQYDATGQKNVLARLGSGEYFGEIGLIEGRERNATVRALTQVQVMAFDRNMFSQWVSETPFVENEIKHTAQERLEMNQEDVD